MGQELYLSKYCCVKYTYKKQNNTSEGFTTLMTISLYYCMGKIQCRHIGVENNQQSASPCVRMLVSGSTAAGSDSADPGLDPGGESSLDPVADMGLGPERGLGHADDIGLGPERGLGHADDRGRTQERLELGCLAELL